MPAPIIYRSSDASAPAIGPIANAGTMITVLDACLVNGYGSLASAGWTNPFSTTNWKAYRPPAGNRFYMDVRDTAAVANYANFTGYLTMTANGTGTGNFGTNGTTANPYFLKSLTWLLAADDRTMFLIMGGSLFYFGDFYSLVAGDAYHSTAAGFGSTSGASTNELIPGGAGMFVARSHTQIGASVSYLIGGLDQGNATGSSSGTGWGNPSWPVVNPGDSGIHVARVSVHSAALGLRGYLRGIWHCPHVSTGFNGTMGQNDVLPGVGDFAGRSFMMWPGSNTWAIETTAWDVSV